MTLRMLHFISSVALAVAGPLTDRVSYHAPDIPAGWAQGARATPDTHITLNFLLVQRNVELLEQTLEAVSDPKSRRYGHHLTRAEVQAMVEPPPYHAAAVRSFLKAASSLTTSTDGDMIEAEMAVGNAEQALGCEFFVYRHVSGETALRTPGYSLPRELASRVATVVPTVMLHTPRRSDDRPSSPRHPDALVNTPKSLRTLYGVDTTQGQSRANKQAVTGFLGQRYSPGDFKDFQGKYLTEKKLGYELSTSPLTCRGDDGGPFVLGGTEAMLDAEYIVSLGANITTEFWGFGGADDPPQRLWIKWLALVQNTSDVDVPKVMSTSYGEDEAYIATDYAERLNVEFMKAGVRGISLMISSGDSGVKGTDPKTKGCPHDKYVPKWPTASPYVTSVGGTLGIGPTYQEAADYSSGGFSNRWKRPSWQDKAVSAYLPALSDKIKKHINNTAGRGFPDVAALGDVMVVAGRLPLPVEGTSCSSPIFSGVVSLLNDLRLAEGKSTLGFLNPFLYANTDALDDIAKGTGDGCRGDDDGFPALRGWDAITGLGTPNYPALAKAAVALQ